MSSEPGRRPATERDNRPMIAELDHLVALSPPDLAALNAAVREVCPATIGLPPLMLTLGLAGVVWGLWGHERWIKATRRD